MNRIGPAAPRGRADSCQVADRRKPMPVSLQPIDSTDQDGELVGHDYRLSDEQYRLAIEGGIINEADGVEFRDGFLCLRSGPSDPRAGLHYRLSVDQYRAMALRDILTTDD